MLKFEIVDQNGNKSLFEFEAGSYTLGKGAKCDVILMDGHVSRLHAKIDVSLKSALLIDLESTNGTWYKGLRLMEPKALSPKEVFNFGDLQLVVLSAPGSDRLKISLTLVSLPLNSAISSDYVELMDKTSCERILTMYGYSEGDKKKMLKGIK